MAATIKGTFYFKGKRPYQYEVTIFDMEGFKGSSNLYLTVTNPEGVEAHVYWDHRSQGIDFAIKEYIEKMVERKRLGLNQWGKPVG